MGQQVAYLAPAYVEATPRCFAEFARLSGRLEPLAGPLPDTPRFWAPRRGAVPKPGDRVIIGQTGRLDGFEADGRHFVLAES